MNRHLILSGLAVVAMTAPAWALATPLTEAAKAAIRQEVRKVSRAWIQAGEHSDFKAAMAFYAPHADFPQAYADVEGKLMDFEGLRKASQEAYDGAVRYEMTVRKEMFTVLDADLVLWAFQGGWRGIMKTGAVLKADACAASVLFKRFGKEWKIVYQHESSPAPEEVKAVGSGAATN